MSRATTAALLKAIQTAQTGALSDADLLRRFSDGNDQAAFAALLRRLGAMVTTANPLARRTLASQSQAALGAIEVDIRLARYEPESVRPSPDWLTARRGVAQAAGEQ